MSATTTADRATATQLPAAAASPPPAWRRKRSLREGLVAAMFLVVPMAVFTTFVFVPLVRTIWLSIHQTDMFGRPRELVWFSQYATLFSDPALRKVLMTTALFALATVIPSILIGLGLALALQAKVSSIGVFRTLMATPFAFSAAAAAVLFDIFYSPSVGVLNGMLARLELPQIGWLTDPSWALLSLAAVIVWRDIAYAMLVLSAGLGSVPNEVTEAAQMDGASSWRTLRSVVLPLLTPSIFFLVVVSTISSLQTFGEINILTQGGPDSSTTTLVYSLYQSAFAFGASNYGMASVKAVVLLLLVMLITVIQFRVLQKRVFYS
ncbi:carbohydrate ABC transporter permease [Pseudactinotalea sp.]|uniref:carbohydrate ABC transporter permease n=1 Tax=Pseudactinotalea sp. TaxID=1926260 RepID=UPI003B3B2DAB